jgi:S1-C subfamily serine protease
MNNMSKSKWILAGFCALMVVSALISAVRRQQDGEGVQSPVHVPESRFAPRQLPIEGSNPARNFSNSIADAVEKVMPSVVVIRTEKIAYRLGRDFFGFTYRIPEQLAGEGSGVIIDEQGYLLTSWHVIEGARQIEVVLNNGTKLPAKYVGHDRAADLAVLRIKGPGGDYPAVEFGNSDKVRVGEVAIAIGSPFSLQSSVTVGHVSQKGRRVQILPYEDFIQTDAAINEGNSGGPLIDVDGRLIGISTAVQTEAEKKGVGIAFAVPSNLAMVIANSLIETGKHEWPWVGAFFYTVDAPYRKTLFEGAGVVVSQVWKDTPAARAGVQPGDLVLSVNGMKVKDEHDVDRIIYNHAVGDKLKFVFQQGKEKQLEVELLLEEYPGTVL